MKPKRKLLNSFVFLLVSAKISLAQTDITISAALDNQITAGPTFTDSGNDGGTSNLNSGTLTTSLNTNNVVVNTATTLPQFAPNGGRITVLDTISNASINNLSLIANSSIEVGTSIALTGGGSLTLDAQGGAVAINSNLTITGGTSNLTIIANGSVTDGASTAINVQGLASINAGANAITLGETNTDSVNFGSLAITGGAVSITENSHTNLQSVVASTLTLSSSGDITDSGNVATTGLATLNGTTITLGGAGENTSFGSLNFNSTGAVNLSLDANTTITGANSGFSVDMSSSGNSSFAVGATLNTASLVQSSGTITLSGNNLVDTMAVNNSGTLTVNGADAINTYQQNGAGSLAGSAALTVSSATLNGGTVSGNLQGNTTSAGTVGVTGTIGGGTLNITNGALTLSGAGSLTSTPISISSGASVINQNGGINNNSNVSNSGTLTVNANDTIGNYVQSTTGTLDGSATLTANGGSTLNGGTINGSLNGNTTATANVIVNGSLGSGTLNVSGGTLTLNGTSANSTVTIAGGASLLNVNGGLFTTGTVNNDGTLTVNATDTVANYNQNGAGILGGSAQLNVTNVAALSGGTIQGSLNGNTTSTGTVNITGTVSGGSLSVNSGTLSLSGTGQATSSSINVASGATISNNSGGIGNASNVVNAGTLTMGANDTANSYTQNGVNGLLQGGSTLTVTTAQLNGGSVSGNLLGNTTSGGNVSITGTVGGGSFTVASGVLTISGAGSITSTPVEIQDFGELINQNSGLSSSSNIVNAGFLTMNSAETANTYVQNDSGELRGTHALSVTNATLNGGTITSNLIGNTTSTGVVTVNGGLSGGTLSVTGGVLTLVGTASNTPVSISQGAQIINQSAGLANASNVTNSGTFTINANETVNTYTQSGALSVLNGTHTLTATNGSILSGGTVSGSLQGNANIQGNVLISGLVGGGALTVTSGTLTLTGSSTHNPVNILAAGTLINQNAGLATTANVDNAGIFTLGMNQTIDTFVNSGLLNGGQTLTTSGTSTFNGGTLANGSTLNAISGTTLNNGSSVAGTITGGAVTSNGSVSATGALNGSSLTVNNGTLTFSGTSTSATVDILTGATMVSTGDLSNSAALNNAGTFTINANDTVASLINSGLINGNSALNTTGISTFNAGTLAAGATVNATGGTTLNNGSSVAGTITGGAVTSNGSINATGALNGSSLTVNNGTLTFSGTSTSDTVSVLNGATLLSTGNLSNSAALTNAGTYTINVNDTVGTYVQNGIGLLNGSSVLTASSGATLNGGTVAASLLANTVSTGNVAVTGTIGGGSFSVTSGRLTLTGTINSSPVVSPGATFQGTGLVTGGMVNQGTLAVGTMGEDLTISGALNTTGTVSLRLLNSTSFEKLTLGSIQQGGNLAVTNVGAGLAVGQTARIIQAGSYSGDFDSLNASGYINGVLYNAFTGTLIGLGGGEIVSDGGYLNLNNNQSNVYFSLFDDSVQPGVQNVSFDNSVAGATTVYLSGISDGDAQLVRALNEATYTTPGSISGNVMNLLSPESHHGMADYSEEALRSAVRKAIDAPTFSLKGKTQIFATLHTTAAGTDNDVTNAGYDLNTAGLTVGARHEMTQTFQAGFLAGMNYGSIEGELIDTDAQGFSLGVFGRLIADTKSKTMVTGSLAFGSNTFDATRTSYEGDVTADSIGASSFEGSLGVSTVIYEKNGFSLSPNATIRYFSGSVDGFTEAGPGVALTVDSQDIDSVVIDVGLNALVPINQQFSFVGRVGYMHELSDSEETIGASFSATGVNAVPFSVNARGIDHQAIILGGGFNYDFIGGGRLGVSYQGEFRFDAQSSQSVYLGYSLGF